MFGWHQQPHGHESEQTEGYGEGQGSLVCCGPWGRKKSKTSERLNSDNKSSPEVVPFIRAMPIHPGESQDSAESSDISLSFAPARLRE